MKLLKNKSFLGALSIVLAAVIAFAVLPHFYEDKADTTYVVRVTQDVPKGTVLTREQLTMSEVGSYGLPSGVIKEESSAVGYVATEDLFSGEYLLENRIALAEEYEKSVEAATKGLVSGYCLVTLKFPTTASGLASVLRAGNLVDVYECREDENENVTVEKRLMSQYVSSVLNQKLESLDDLDAMKEQSLEENVEYDFAPAYVVFRCTEEDAMTLIRLEKEESLHLTLTSAEG